MMPKVSTGRLSAMLASRQRWCISRQRPWGLPIPVFYNKEDPRAPPLITEETVKYVSSVFAEEGSTAWWQRDTADLLPPTMSAEEKAKYEKGRDTLDVWFDSGCTWNSVLRERGLPTPSDLVLEGSDQHRGWFQSSLLTSVASTSAVDEDGKREWGGAPYRAIYTHGFVLDGEGRKMSKSVGNVVSPQMVVNGTGDAAASGGGKKGKGVKGKGKGKGGGGGKWPAYGADVLRWWAVSVDSTRDVAMSREGMEKTFENVRRLRNTIRYLLGNLNDFHPADHLPGFVSAGDESIKLEFERQLDAYVAKRLFSTIHTSSSDLSSLLFPKYAASLTSFVSADLSSLYFEAIKDRLYADERDGKSRRSAQAVLYLTYDRLVRVLTPSLPHLCEDAFQHSPVYQRIPDLEGFLKSGSMGEAGTVMEYTWPSTSEWEVQRSQHNGVNDVDEDEAMRRVLNMRDSVKRVLEKSRNEGLVGSSTDADVTLQVDTNAAPLEKALSWFDGVPVLGSTTSGAVELPALAELSVTSSFDVSKADDREWEWKHATYVDANGNTVDNENDAAARLIVHQPKGGKCARCWRWLAPSSGALCQRCSDVLVQQ
uniref:Isoleucyl-tRNA synthetase n=1 Tax=Palpitomonas bilix TaxID=652834 RepID=A0A7S3G5Q9_9EUKA